MTKVRGPRFNPGWLPVFHDSLNIFPSLSSCISCVHSCVCDVLCVCVSTQTYHSASCNNQIAFLLLIGLLFKTPLGYTVHRESTGHHVAMTTNTLATHSPSPRETMQLKSHYTPLHSLLKHQPHYTLFNYCYKDSHMGTHILCIG